MDKKSSTIFFLGLTILSVVGLSTFAFANNSNIPDWIKNNAKWWSEGTISETDYITSLQYLVTNGIIQIPITEVTAAQTSLTDEERAQSFKVTISNIVAPISTTYFEKFEMTTSKSGAADDPRGRMYEFRDNNPKFFLESLPSADKKQFYKFVSDWMDGGSLLNKFNIDIDVLDGKGSTIQTWKFDKCEITSYGTYLQDTVFIYQFSGIQDSEIRDRTNFSCVGVHLVAP
ncbi:Glucose dehydrogenase PQQ-dependent [metagenome]